MAHALRREVTIKAQDFKRSLWDWADSCVGLNPSPVWTQSQKTAEKLGAHVFQMFHRRAVGFKPSPSPQPGNSGLLCANLGGPTLIQVCPTWSPRVRLTQLHCGPFIFLSRKKLVMFS